MPTNTTTRMLQVNGSKAGSPLEAALRDLTRAKESIRDATATLGAASAHLKQAKQDRRAVSREIRTVRSALKSLRKVRL
jgi:hypothetical protein